MALIVYWLAASKEAVWCTRCHWTVFTRTS